MPKKQMTGQKTGRRHRLLDVCAKTTFKTKHVAKAKNHNTYDRKLTQTDYKLANKRPTNEPTQRALRIANSETPLNQLRFKATSWLFMSAKDIFCSPMN